MKILRERDYAGAYRVMPHHGRQNDINRSLSMNIISGCRKLLVRVRWAIVTDEPKVVRESADWLFVFVHRRKRPVARPEVPSPDVFPGELLQDFKVVSLHRLAIAHRRILPEVWISV